MALVRNVKDSSKFEPPSGYESWKEYWEEQMGRKFSVCSCRTCSRAADVGGHVEKVYGSGEIYIVPICYNHNNHTYINAYEVNDFDLLPVYN